MSVISALSRVLSKGGMSWALLAVAVFCGAAATYVLVAPAGMGARSRDLAKPSTRVIPAQEVPTVEPVTLQQVSPEEARAFNASVPFSSAPNPAARAFRLLGSDDDKARAVDCLAAAVLYEAGNDAIGEQAVAQVVINRVRHPAFPKTICGVVFQGSDRATGCQFTFSCDGALARPPQADQWELARGIATNALQGSVFKPVGYATHYHTDWVVPYWQSSLDKVTKVHTHLFFRWTGWWGKSAAFTRRVLEIEPVVPLLAAFSAAHGAPAALADPLDAVKLDTTPIQPIAGDANVFLFTFDALTSPADFAEIASGACADRVKCRFLGWAEPGLAGTALPMSPAQSAALAFSYVRDRGAGVDRASWDCDRYPRPVAGQCMPARTAASAPPIPPKPRIDTLPPPPVVTDRKGSSWFDAKPAPPPAAATTSGQTGAPAPAPSSGRPVHRPRAGSQGTIW